jgi:Flp pilus assembly protein TadD
MGASLFALIITGCAAAPQYTPTEREMSDTMGADSFQPAPRSLRDSIETQELLAQAAFWMREYELNPADLEAAIKLSAVIRKVGNPQRAVEIAQTTRALYPKDPYLTAEYAAALIASERALDAMQPLDQALSYAPAYGRLWSLKGAALDQQGQYELARKHYARALQITPNDPNVMANLGLSYALAGDPNTAEGWLRRAASIPGASKSVHQNLALILQIQGKTDEAENISRLAQTQQTGRLPDLNARPAQRLRGSMPAQNPQAPSQSLRQASPAQPMTQPQPMAQTQNPYVRNGFSAPPPQVTVNNSPSLRSQSSANASQTGSTQPRSASEAARMAAAKSGQRPQSEVITPTQAQQQQDILAKLANSVGARAANPALRNIQPSQSAPYYPGRSQQVPTQPSASQTGQAPQQANAYPSRSYNNYAQETYPAQPPQSRGSARTRR